MTPTPEPSAAVTTSELRKALNALEQAAGVKFWQDDQGYNGEDIQTASDERDAARRRVDHLIAALACRSAPTTGGAARLDREAVETAARAIYNRQRQALPDQESVNAQRPFSSGDVPSIFWDGYREDAKAAILAIVHDAPESQAASEGVREAIGWHEPSEKPNSGSKIIWLYEDGSGARLLYVHDDGFICGEEGIDWKPYRASWMGRWAYLPSDTILSCETGEEPCVFPAAITPAGRGADAGGWRPIETAPKDGTKFDAWVVHPYSGGMGFRFADVQMRGDGSGFGVVTHQPKAVWDYIEQSGPTFPCWRLTHWMPSPAAPTVQEGE